MVDVMILDVKKVFQVVDKGTRFSVLFFLESKATAAV